MYCMGDLLKCWWQLEHQYDSNLGQRVGDVINLHTS